MWMTPHPVAVRPDTPAAEAAVLMGTRRLRRLPVVAGDGKVVGILSKTDLLRACPSEVNPFAAERQGAGDLQFAVARVMTTAVVTIDADAPIEDAAALLRARQLGALPVLRRGELVGMLSQTDIARAFQHMVLADGARRVTVEAAPGADLLPPLLRECGTLGLRLRAYVELDEPDRHLVVLSVRGEPLQPLLDRLWQLGGRVLHVSR